jgi:hypothetical protein
MDPSFAEWSRAPRPIIAVHMDPGLRRDDEKGKTW